MGLYTCVIVNPASANGATGRHWPEIRAALDAVLDRWDNQFTVAQGDATRLAREAVEAGYERIACVGGDGTMNEVVNGLFPADEAMGIGSEPLRSDLVLASIRAGTGGDFARYLDLPHKLPDAVQHLGSERTRACDLGLVELTDHDGRPIRRAFLNIASFGLSGVVVDKVNHSSKALGGGASFMLGLGKAMASYRRTQVRITVDGEPLHDGLLVTCAVANGQYFGGGMRFARDAQIDNGRFDVVVQERTGVKEVLNIQDLYSGKMAEWPSVNHRRGRVVVATSDDRVLMDVDGEQPGRLPATFTLLPSAVRVQVP